MLRGDECADDYSGGNCGQTLLDTQGIHMVPRLDELVGVLSGL